MKKIRIGTRGSQLALWQAMRVQDELKKLHLQTELVEITSDGELLTEQPLYNTGIQGIFTKALDTALLNNEIDIAVHSYKDVPTTLAKGLRIAAVLERGNPKDVIVYRNEQNRLDIENNGAHIIATSSIRRKAQWLYRYKNAGIENIRGNVQTRLQKLNESGWHGTLFAMAGLERLQLQDTLYLQTLDWMVPAPAQGAIAISCRKDNTQLLAACTVLNHRPSEICTLVEREFLRILQGGCATPISAYASLDQNEITFRANITSPDGSETADIFIKEKLANYLTLPGKAAQQLQEKKRRVS